MAATEERTRRYRGSGCTSDDVSLDGNDYLLIFAPMQSSMAKQPPIQPEEWALMILMAAILLWSAMRICG